jgi:hypothetical protein
MSKNGEPNSLSLQDYAVLHGKQMVHQIRFLYKIMQGCTVNKT